MLFLEERKNSSCFAPKVLLYFRTIMMKQRIQIQLQMQQQHLQSNNRKKKNSTTHFPTRRMNLFTAINDAMKIALQTDPTAIVFGEDEKIGGVFRCSQDLYDTYGNERVFNTPLSENGIAG